MARKFQVNSRVLLSLYLIIPVCILVVLVDKIFLGEALLKQYLPVQPAEWAFWTLVFNFPHIVSSFVTLADKEYVKFYKKRFGTALAVITAGVVALTAVLLILPGAIAQTVYGVFFAFFATYTMYHVLSQQFGIGMMLMKVRPGKQYEQWRWLSTITTTGMYAMVFGQGHMEAMFVGGYSAYAIANVVAGIALIAATYIGFQLTGQSQRKLGTLYVYSNMAMLIFTFIFMQLEYTVFVILIPRFVHDITAFIIYSTHDQNRNSEGKKNYFYKALAILPLPPLLLCPLLAIGIANTLELYASLLFFKMFYFICSFFHYYIEGFVWKRDAIHRHAVSFS
ncbi:MAG: hypothetical protein HRU20_27235 [Pseudomonadales bacterium]|nr:hypothetical protein [Pseudomonadales bacterium]